MRAAAPGPRWRSDATVTAPDAAPALALAAPGCVRVVDARGKPCPLPIVELARALREASPKAPSAAAPGDVGTLHQDVELELWADDPAVEADLRAFCAATGHALAAFHRDGPFARARVQARAPRRSGG